MKLALRVKMLSGRWRELVFWALAPTVVVISGLVAGFLKDCIEALFTKDESIVRSLLLLLISLVFLFAATLVLYRLRRVLARPRTRGIVPHTDVPRREHLVLFLSNIGTNQIGTAYNELCEPTWLELQDDLAEDLRRLAESKGQGRNWSWEMPLRAVHYHIDQLETITLVCSPESIAQAALFTKVLARYRITRAVKVQVLGWQDDKPVLSDPDDLEEVKGCDFESFDRLTEGLLWLFSALRKVRGARDDQIVVDFTGGQKPSSVVAAAVTFNSEIAAQYIRTGGNHEVLGYDILQGPPEKEELIP